MKSPRFKYAAECYLTEIPQGIKYWDVFLSGKPLHCRVMTGWPHCVQAQLFSLLLMFFFLFFFEECSEVHTFPCASLNKLWHKLLAARRHELKCHPAYAQAPSTHPPNQATPLHPTSTSTLAPLRSVCQSHSGTDTAFVQKQVKGRFAASWEGLAPCHTLSRSVSPPGMASWHREGTGTQSWPSCRSSE